MKWKDEAISKLKDYAAKKVALENLPMEIQEQEQSLGRIRSSDPDAVPVRGSGNREDALLNAIVYRGELEEAYALAKRWVCRVERGLELLNPEERILLERFFIRPEAKAADRLAGDLHMDVKTVYRRKDDALRKFTYALYGASES